MKNCKKPTLRMAFGGAFGTIPRGISVGGLRAMNEHEDALRRDATSRYGIDTQSATARMGDATSRYGIDAQSANARLGADTQRYGYDTSAASHRYGVDAQSATSRMNDLTQRYQIGTQADTQRYGFDTQAGTQRYGFNNQADIARMNDLTQRYQIGTQADTQRYGYDATKAASMYGADSNLLSSMWHMKNGGEVPARVGLRNGGELHAFNGFTPGGFAESAGQTKWLSPVDQQRYQMSAQAADDAHAMAQAKVAQTTPRAPMPGEEAMAAQQALNTYNQGMLERQKKLQWAGEDRGFAANDRAAAENERAFRFQNAAQDRAFAVQDRERSLRDTQEQKFAQMNDRASVQNAAMGMPGYAARGVQPATTGYIAPQPDPYAAQDRARLENRRNMYDRALRGHFGAGGFGLRNGGTLQTGMGGDVPGTGEGDKIPAKYEPGEFVVSNDMLDAQPGLRGHLRTLREQVLADKGMTVAEADAKAVGKGRGLRASEGADGEALKQRRMRDFNLTAADYGAIEGGLQAKEQRGENIRNALSKNDGFAKIAALNQQAANADARVQADAARGVYRDVDPVASPELTQKIDDGRRSDLRSYVDAQSMRDPGGALPTVPKSLRDTGNIYKTIDALGRTTYSGGNVKEGAKFIGNDGNEFTPRGSVEYAKPGEAVGMFLGGGGAVFTPASTDPTQRATDITTAKVNATAFRDQRAAQDAEEARAYHEAGMAGNREIAKNQALRDIDARVKEAQNVLSMRSLADNDPRKLAALKVVDDAGAMLQGVEKSYAEGEASRVRDATTANTTLRAHAMDNETTLRAADINSQRTLAAARLPYEVKQREAAMITDALNRTKGNPDAAVDLLMRSGAVMAAKTLSEQAAADETRKAAEAEHMTKLFKGKVIDAETGNEIPNGAEMAANRLLELTGGKIVDAPTLAKMQHEAILDTRLTYAQQKATRGRNSSIWASIAGDEPMPTGPNPSVTPEKLGWWGGLTTGGGISRNDFAYGDGRYIPAASGDDVIKRAQDLARKNAGLPVK